MASPTSWRLRPALLSPPVPPVTEEGEDSSHLHRSLRCTAESRCKQERWSVTRAKSAKSGNKMPIDRDFDKRNFEPAVTNQL